MEGGLFHWAQKHEGKRDYFVSILYRVLPRTRALTEPYSPWAGPALRLRLQTGRPCCSMSSFLLQTGRRCCSMSSFLLVLSPLVRKSTRLLPFINFMSCYSSETINNTHKLFVTSTVIEFRRKKTRVGL